MSRAIWVDDEAAYNCAKCNIEFRQSGFEIHKPAKHHCRNCGLVFCETCSSNKLLIPAEKLVLRPQTWSQKQLPSSIDLLSDNSEDSFRAPQRVCDKCVHVLKNVQGQLREAVAKYNQETQINYNSVIPSMPGLNFQLDQEISKASILLHSFKNTTGEEKIPKELLELSAGVVFLTIFKVGFMFTGRYGTGIVLSKLRDGSWSAPSAVMLTGLGWGLQIGAEVTDVMLILSSDSAVETFKSRAQVSLGAELGVSVGPVGRSIGSDVTAGNKGAAHAFSYAHSKGLFFGASLEASGIASRPDVNRAFYGEDVSPSALLSGDYPRPKAADQLYRLLNEIMSEKQNNNSTRNQQNSYYNSNPSQIQQSIPVPVAQTAPQQIQAPVQQNNQSQVQQQIPVTAAGDSYELEDSEGHYL